MPKKTRPSKKRGWAQTRFYPHARHPANYRKCPQDGDAIDYLTFTHSPCVDLGKKQVPTIPLSESVSKSEREQKRRGTLPKDKERSYVYPRVFHGKRSSLGKESDEFDPVEADAKTIDALFETLEHENVPAYGGKGKLDHSRKKKKDPSCGVETVPQSKHAPMWRDQVRSSRNERQRSTPSNSSISKKYGLSIPKNKKRSRKYKK